MDIVPTLCDRAANRALPVWPGNPVQGHWGLPDPVAEDTAEGCARTCPTLRARLRRLAGRPAAPTRSGRASACPTRGTALSHAWDNCYHIDFPMF
jgi:hypothetical protein